jgi:hypothetical protein
MRVEGLDMMAFSNTPAIKINAALGVLSYQSVLEGSCVPYLLKYKALFFLKK